MKIGEPKYQMHTNHHKVKMRAHIREGLGENTEPHPLTEARPPPLTCRRSGTRGLPPWFPAAPGPRGGYSGTCLPQETRDPTAHGRDAAGAPQAKQNLNGCGPL